MAGPVPAIFVFSRLSSSAPACAGAGSSGRSSNHCAICVYWVPASTYALRASATIPAEAREASRSLGRADDAECFARPCHSRFNCQTARLRSASAGKPAKPTLRRPYSWRRGARRRPSCPLDNMSRGWSAARRIQRSTPGEAWAPLAKGARRAALHRGDFCPRGRASRRGDERHLRQPDPDGFRHPSSASRPAIEGRPP